MIHTIIAILNRAEASGGRAVVLVPDAAYWTALSALVCKYQNYIGRSARMVGGELVTVLTPSTPVSEVGENFGLFLAGWGGSTPREERALQGWVAKATQVTTEVS